MELISRFNNALWGGPILLLLFGVHIYFTIRTGFVQRKIKNGIQLSLGNDGKKGMSAFGTLTTTLAATLGTGNIIGVSTAVFYGGPGAVFWCWITGVLGMATAYQETVLCCSYRTYKKNGTPLGGMMYVLERGLGKKKMAILYASCICLSAFFIGCTTQSNAMAEICESTFGISTWVVGVVAALVVGFVIIRGARGIEKICIKLVPVMTIFFVIGCFVFLVTHINSATTSVDLIIKAAFNKRCITGGILGASMGRAMRYGVSRGLFTNEAGLGTAGIAACGGAEYLSPKEQGLISMSACFWDTVVMCAITGVVAVTYVVECQGNVLTSEGMLVQGAFSMLPGGAGILAVSVILFALATLIGWSYFGNVATEYLGKSWLMELYPYFYVFMIFVGAVIPMNVVWEFTDFINLFLLLFSLYGLFYGKVQKNL